MNDLAGILIPIFICVVLPVSIVFILAWVKKNNEDKRAEIILKAIEANNSVDVDKLTESLRDSRKTEREIRNRRLLNGCIYGLLGLVGVLTAIFNYANGIPVESDYVTLPLLAGGASMAIGLSFLIVYFVTAGKADADSEK